jgi:two-component system OmpR family sensor kinase
MTGRWSLRSRVAVWSLAVVVVVVVASDVLMTLTLREEFDRQVERAMAARVALVEDVVARLDADADPAALAAELQDRGVPAVVVGPDGRRHPSAPDGTLPPPPHAVQVVAIGDGRVEVLVSRAAAEATQRRVLLAGLGTTVLALGAAALVVALSTDRLLRPLDEVVTTARAIARGRTGARVGDAIPARGDLGRLAEAFDEMLDVQETALASARAEEARSRRFLADAAHQLRTPVAGLRAASEALLHDPGTRDRDRLLAHLARESARTGRLLDALLRVAEQDRGDAPPARPADLSALVRAEAARQEPLAPRVDLRVDAPPSAVVVVDADGLREAVANLLDNARRHAASRIDVEVVDGGDEVVIAVRDDGPGVPPGEEERIFERFVSLDDRGGAGLGLPIARAAVRAQGGELRCEDGAFVLRLPRVSP